MYLELLGVRLETITFDLRRNEGFFFAKMEMV